MSLYHFSGVAGAGMNPLARLMRAWGHEVQGSDRSFDHGQNQGIRADLEACGVRILPQDGNAVVAGIDRFVYSAAVEPTTPEAVAARALGLAMLARPALLAEVVDGGQPGIAVAGTSGKSSVTGMIAWCLRHARHPATALGGAAIEGEGQLGLYHGGPRDGAVVAEACESDGTLVGYHPGLGIIHNISRDHDELDGLRRQFGTFAGNCRTLLVNTGCAEASRMSGARTLRYGTGAGADVALEVLAAGPWSAKGVIAWRDGATISIALRHPGAHNLDNACAAAAALRELGLAPAAIAAGLESFPGTYRRFHLLGRTDTGIAVVDDYAHNGEKIRAAIAAAQEGAARVIAVFQPHGFGPARYLRPELREILPATLREQDRMCYLPIYYAGGTVAQDIRHSDLAHDIGAAAPATREEFLAWIAEEARPGDTVLMMGARDPSLGDLAHAVFGLL